MLARVSAVTYYMSGRHENKRAFTRLWMSEIYHGKAEMEGTGDGDRILRTLISCSNLHGTVRGTSLEANRR